MTNDSFSTGITGSGNAIKIFSAVGECLRDFVRRMNPKAFAFSALEPSRKKLYDVLSQKIAQELGWKVEMEDFIKIRKYYITAK